MEHHLYNIFSLVGSPARLSARILFVFRYTTNLVWIGSPWLVNEYGRARFGRRYRWMFWMAFDIVALQQLEDLLNHGSDDEVLYYRRSQLDAFSMVAIVGALLAQIGISALSLPRLESTHYVARGLLTCSVVLSLKAIFFTCYQQRILGIIRQPAEFRAWLSNGVQYRNTKGTTVFQSSVISHQFLQAPFELLGIAITLFLAALGVYLGSAHTRNVPLNSDGSGGIAVLLAYVSAATFGLGLFGFLLGGKDAEEKRSVRQLDHFGHLPVGNA